MEKINQWLRSPRLWTVVASIAIMALVSFVYFYPDDVQGNVLMQHDTQQGLANGQEAAAYAAATGENSRWTGSLFSGMPTFQISPSYPSDTLFRWIHQAMGLWLPAPANLLMMMMVGFFILLMAMGMRWWVSLIGAIAYGFSSYFIIIIGAGHIMKFMTLAYIPPTIAGIVLAYRGRYLGGAALAALAAMMQIASNHVQMTYYFMFVIAGFVIAYLVGAVRQKQMAQWGKATGALAVAAVLAVAANMPNLYNTYEYSKETMRGGHSELTQPQGEQSTDGLNRDYITQYSYMPSENLTLLIPNVKGGASNRPAKGQNLPMSLAELDQTKEMVAEGRISADEQQYLGYMSQYFGDPEGTNGPVYVGALIFALFLLGCAIVKGPLKWALVVLTVLSVLLAMGRHFMTLTDLMIDYMPMYSKFRTVESILVIAEFTMPLLAAMALQQLFKSGSPEEAWTRYRKPVLWSFGITLGLCLIGIIAPGFYGDIIGERDREIADYIAAMLSQQGADAQMLQYYSLDNPRIYQAIETLREQLVATDAMRSFLIVGAGFGILMLWMRRRLSAGVAAVLVGIIICGDLFMVNKRYLSTDSFMPRQLAQGEAFPLTDADRVILADTTTDYRVMNIPQFWQAGPSFRHKTVGGYHAAKLTRYQDLIDRHLSHFLDGTETDADWNVLNMLNARWIVDMKGQPLQNPEAMGPAWLVGEIEYVDTPDEEMEALSAINPAQKAVADKRFAGVLGKGVPVAATDTIRLTSYAPNRLTYHTESASGNIAVLSEVYFPWGWHADIDGKPVEIGRVNYVLRAVRIPAGSHTLTLSFNPESLRTTTAAAYVAIALIYLLCIGAVALAVVRAGKTRKDEADK